MGRGNYMPQRWRNWDQDDFTMVYTPYPEYDSEIDNHFWYEQLMDDIENTLPMSFYEIDEWPGRTEHDIWENGHFTIAVADNEWSVAIIVKVNDGGDYGPMPQYPLACARLHSFANKFFGDLEERGYQLRVRTGPWTSAPRVQQEAA